MKPRLRKYLEKLGLAASATAEEAQEMFDGLTGLERTVANLLDHDESDAAARTSCDLALRQLGLDPEDPSQNLRTVDPPAAEPQPADAPVSSRAAGDGDSAESVFRRLLDERESAERARRQGIRQLGASADIPAEVVDTAILAGESVDQARQRFLDHHSRSLSGAPVDIGGAPAGHSRNSQTDYTRDSLIAAMMLRHGVADPTRVWPVGFRGAGLLQRCDANGESQMREHAHRATERGHQLVGMSMVEIAARAMAIDGVRIADPSAIAIGREIQQRANYGFATLTAVFTTSYTAVLMDGYDATEDTTGPFVVERPVRDYKVQERIWMGSSSGPKLRRPMQEAESVTFSDQREVYRVWEFANQFTFDQQDLINDSFDALQGYVPRDMGITYREIQPNLVYSILMANANMRDGVALFHASHGNLTTSAALTEATLSTARSKVRLQRDGSRNLNLNVRHLIVPPSLGDTAYTATKSRNVVLGADAVRGELNAVSRHGINVIEDARLENGVVDPVTETAYAGSATTWFVSTGQERPMIEVGYVAELGREPSVRADVLRTGRFGIAFDIQRTLGGKALDWRGLGKATA